LRIGNNCTIGNYVDIGNEPFSSKNGKMVEAKYSVKIGNNVFINPFTSIALGTVRDTTIGDNTIIDTHVILGHDVQVGINCERDTHVSLLGHVTIGDNSRICTGAVIHPKVTIGNNCVVGANSYLRRDMPDNTICYGNPAIFRDRTNYKI
jgi:UDP-3-O-[3-hydroxymyristoyl] glucosamine N-acyltransferase